jgi:recombination protein RecA
LDIRRIGAITENQAVLGNRVRVKIVKNKVAPPFREAEFDVIFNEGISKTGEILDVGVDKGVVDRAGAWYSYKGERLGQGREGAKVFLKENPEVFNEIRGIILSTVGIDGTPTAPKGQADEAAEEPKAMNKGKKGKKTSASESDEELEMAV